MCGLATASCSFAPLIVRVMLLAATGMPTDSIAATSACDEEMAGAPPAALSADANAPSVRISRPWRSRMKRASLPNTGTLLITCSARSIRRPLPRLRLSPRKRTVATSPGARP